MFNQNSKIMKNLLVLLFSFFVFSAFAQSGSGGRYDGSLKGQSLRGFLIDDKGDTVRGFFKIETHYYMQDGPWITPDKPELKNKNFIYKNVAYYEIENNTKWFSTVFTILKAPTDARRMTPDALLNVEEYGPITLYNYDFYNNKVDPPTEKVDTYMQLPNGDVIDLADVGLLMSFKKRMSSYVKDYPELATKILNKEKGYGILGINNIVREYNKWYMAKNPNYTLLKK